MKLTRSHLLVTFLAVSAAACDNRLLVGEGPDGGSPSGAAGTTGAAGTMGAAGTTPLGSAGTTGAAGTGSHLTTPLPIPADEAVDRAAQVIWKAAPDGELSSPAGLELIKTPSDLHAPVRRLLADPRARAGVGAFYRWWLELDAVQALTKDTTTFPDFTPALAADVATETETFGVNVTLAPNGTYRTLMTAPYTYGNGRIAALYGVPGFEGVTTFERLDLNMAERAGLLTQPALQAFASSSKRNRPSKRGALIITKFLCRDLPLSPADIPDPAPAAPGVTTRQWLDANVSVSASCTACHTLIDPFGYAFESFDAIGRSRTTDNGSPVDVSGLRLNPFSPPPVVEGAVELANTLAGRPEAQECMVRQWLSYALNRKLTDADDKSVAQALATFQASGLDLKELIFAVLTTDAFLKP